MVFRHILILTLIFLLVSCSNKDKPLYEPSSKVEGYTVYKEGLDAFEKNDFFFASKKFDEAEFCTWMAEQCIVAMVPRFIEIFEGGYPMTATQKVKVAELKEISDKTWDRAKSGLKFSSRK